MKAAKDDGRARIVRGHLRRKNGEKCSGHHCGASAVTDCMEAGFAPLAPAGSGFFSSSPLSSH